MKIGIGFFGIIYEGIESSRKRDSRHCWPNLKKMIVDPYIKEGHEVKIYFSTYRTEEKIQEEFISTVGPHKIFYNNFKGSNAFTTKIGTFNLLDDDLDFIILTRSDAHWNQYLIEQNIKYDKFNFLFPENFSWKDKQQTCDNFYAWPYSMTDIVKESLIETYNSLDEYDLPHTHNLFTKIIKYLDIKKINFISTNEEGSHINFFYSICRDGLSTVLNEKIHPEVAERFGYKV